MYNGLFSDTSDNISVLQQQIDLIAGLNTQLKEFSSLKSNISDVFEIIKLGGEKTQEAAKFGKELSAASKLNTELMGAISSNTDQLASATNTASASQKSFTSFLSLSAIQITAVIVAITAVVAAISMFVKWLNRTKKAGEAAKTSAKNLVSAQEELSQSAIDSSAVYAQTTASLQAAGGYTDQAGDVLAYGESQPATKRGADPRRTGGKGQRWLSAMNKPGGGRKRGR